MISTLSSSPSLNVLGYFLANFEINVCQIVDVHKVTSEDSLCCTKLC